ncbi:MAG: hypothetical protein K6F71_12565 [Ruminococcus sp.]|uniref:hypothetical protein n=1 Tax=Ruminococcus sp. TaxID=41978 RepID=UPI0025E1CAAC|nr:hypothetical protein [Ruminococcus sp.]MCR5541632.1 hypothetical protein [Ruminococcus sp.]
METLIVLIVVTVLLVILGVSAEMLIIGFLGLLCLMMAALFLFFAYCIIRMTRSKKCRGKLATVTKHPKHGFSVPVYEIDGEKYENVFPCEIVMKKQLYYEGRECRLLLDKKRSKVFDGNARISSILGIILSGVSFAMILDSMIDMLG